MFNAFYMALNKGGCNSLIYLIRIVLCYLQLSAVSVRSLSLKLSNLFPFMDY